MAVTLDSRILELMDHAWVHNGCFLGKHSGVSGRPISAKLAGNPSAPGSDERLRVIQQVGLAVPGVPRDNSFRLSFPFCFQVCRFDRESPELVFPITPIGSCAHSIFGLTIEFGAYSRGSPTLRFVPHFKPFSPAVASFKPHDNLDP